MVIAIDDWHFFGIVFISLVGDALFCVRLHGKNWSPILQRICGIEFNLTVVKINFIVTGNYRRYRTANTEMVASAKIIYE
jgi:hypothetical protein